MLEEEELKEFLAYISLQMSRLEAQRKCLQTANEREFDALSRSLSLPSKGATDKLLRYETHVERQLARDMADLERRQMRRRGEPVSPRLANSSERRLVLPNKATKWRIINVAEHNPDK